MKINFDENESEAVWQTGEWLIENKGSLKWSQIENGKTDRQNKLF